MASYYGEILPVISRSADDEEDDEFAPQPRPLIVKTTSPSKDCETLCDCLVVTVGEVAWRFAESFFDLSRENKWADVEETRDEDHVGYEAISKSPKIGTRDNFASVRCENMTSFALAAISFHTVSSGQRKTTFAVCKGHHPPEQIWPVTNKILGIARGYEEVFVLSSSPVQEYKCDDPALLEAPFVKSLATSPSPTEHPVYPTLEQPNMFKNIVAAVISRCHILRVPAVAYVCFTENIHTDPASVLSLNQLLNTTQFRTAKDVGLASKDIVRLIANSHAKHGSLYT